MVTKKPLLVARSPLEAVQHEQIPQITNPHPPSYQNWEQQHQNSIQVLPPSSNLPDFGTVAETQMPGAPFPQPPPHVNAPTSKYFEEQKRILDG
jgi:hypothetical protein